MQSSAGKLASIRSRIVTLVLACTVPAVLGFAALSYDAYTRERDHLEHDAARSAQILLAALERDLGATETATRVLASAPSLASGDLAAFRAQAETLPGSGLVGFVLSDPHGRVLFNTRQRTGQAPPNPNAPAVAEVARRGVSAMSNLYAGDLREPHLLSVDVPVRVNGAVAYVLSAEMRPQHLNELLAGLHLPPGWTAQLFDGRRVFVARTRNPARVIGQPAYKPLIDALKTRDHGVIPVTSPEGVAMLSAYQRSSTRGWVVGIGVPQAATRGALDSTLPTILLAVGALLCMGCATAWVLGGAIGRAVRGLTRAAAALGQGDALVIEPLHIREPAEVAQALRKVDTELQRYRNDLESLVAARTDELQRSNALLASVYASAQVGMMMVDVHLRVTMVNDYLLQLNGIDSQAYLGRTLPELLGPTGLQYEGPFRQVRDTGEALSALEVTSETPHDPEHARHWIASYHPVRDTGGALVGISCVVVDVTERRMLSERLRDVNEQFRALYDMSDDAHMLLAQGAGFIGGNQAAARLFGCSSADELIHLSPSTTSPEFQPDGRRSEEKAEQFVRLALETGSHHFEWLHRRRDGSAFHADVLLISLNIGGKGILQATVRDITARIDAERALRATSEQLQHSEQFIRTVTDNVPGMVGYWDAQLRCRFANRLYQEWFGLSEQALVGQSIDQVLGPDGMRDNAGWLREVMAGRPAHFAHEQSDAQGQTRHTWANYIPDFDENQQVRGFFVLISDISELKRTELRLQSLNEQLVQALGRAERASSAKNEFLANMSHEIRTPMNAIMGLARLLEEAPLAKREREYVAKIMMSTRSLLGILNDVLDYARIEAGQLTLESSHFTLEQVLRSVTVLVAHNAAHKGVELVYDVAPDVPLALQGDPMRLEQVLLNLISNAIKFTEQGEVVLTVRVLGRSEDELALGLSVRDTGIGISAAQQERMFEAFSQGDSSSSRRFGGTGLGLAICRRLVQLMRGSIKVRSEPGQGSEFSVEVSLGATPDAPVLALPDLPARRILIVDDHASVRHALAAQCRALGWDADSAPDGAQALALLQAAEARTPYDFMLLDHAMPGMDGIALLTHARAALGDAAPRAAMMVTESARERFDELAAGLDLDGILNKPVLPGALAALLVTLATGRAPQAAAPEHAALAGRLEGLYVLLVEDNQINQEVAHFLLHHAGAQVDIAANGRIAVSMLAEHPTRYDAVLMDIQMPVLNGYEAAIEIRAMGLRALPIIAMTANAMDDDRAHAIEAGMDGHVAKPIDVDRLLAALNRVSAGGAEREAQVRALPAALAVALPMTVPSVAGIDLGPTLQRFGGSFDNFVALFKRFEGSQGGTLLEVRALVRAGQREQAMPLLHRLRGVAANLGAAQVASLALAAEGALRSADETTLATVLTRLDAALAEVFQAARALPAPAHAPVPAAATALSVDPAALADLLALLQNNNMKAIAAFNILRPALQRTLAPEQSAVLAEAIASLAFANAAALVQDVIRTSFEVKGSA